MRQMRVQILEPCVRNNLRHRRRPQLNEESFGSFNLLPRSENVRVLL